MELKVIEPIRNYLKEFNSADEFNIWYSKNKESIDGLTTHKLNKMYHIDGYKITRIKNELMLKKDNIKTKNKLNDSLIDEIENLKEEINEIKDTINKIILFLKNNDKDNDLI